MGCGNDRVLKFFLSERAAITDGRTKKEEIEFGGVKNSVEQPAQKSSFTVWKKR